MPSKEEAFQFALMLQCGLPPADALLYFVSSEDPAELATTLKKWLNAKSVKDAMTELMGKSWQDLTDEERLKRALENHYNQLAYFLFSHNYSTLGPTDKAKADTARQAIEAKLAGQAGKVDAFSRFFEDFQAGKLKDKVSTFPKVGTA